MMAARCPDLAGKVLEELEKATASEAECLRQASATKDVLSSEGFECPSWREVHNGLRPLEPPQTAEPGEVRHGWQYHAASRRETYYREAVVLTERGRPSQALLRSQAGRCAGEHLTLLPLSEELQWENAKLRALLLRRLRLPLDLDERRCRCGKTLDWLGDHRAACGTGGVLQTRAVPLERMWARVGREAGARVRTHTYLNDLNVLRVKPTDGRRLEVVLRGLPANLVGQVAVDATLVSPLTRKGAARPRAHWQDGAALKDARKKKVTTFSELLKTRRCTLAIAEMNVGER